MGLADSWMLNKNVIGASVQSMCLLHVTCKCTLERTSQEVEGWSTMGVYKMRVMRAMQSIEESLKKTP